MAAYEDLKTFVTKYTNDTIKVRNHITHLSSVFYTKEHRSNKKRETSLSNLLTVKPLAGTEHD